MSEVPTFMEVHGRPVIRTYLWVDKRGWGDGPWQTEWDKVHWIDPATDLDCLAVRNAEMGHWCAYVGVPPGHPAHGLGTDDVDPEVQVHGGITFAAPCQEAEDEAAQPLVEERGVCHVPLPGRPEAVFWLGFDCCHAWDISPGNEALYRRLGIPQATIDAMATLKPWKHYRTLEYVMAECEQLAAQLARLGAPADGPPGGGRDAG
jgi:hypothetical protein